MNHFRCEGCGYCWEHEMNIPRTCVECGRGSIAYYPTLEERQAAARASVNKSPQPLQETGEREALLEAQAALDKCLEDEAVDLRVVSEALLGIRAVLEGEPSDVRRLLAEAREAIKPKKAKDREWCAEVDAALASHTVEGDGERLREALELIRDGQFEEGENLSAKTIARAVLAEHPTGECEGCDGTGIDRFDPPVGDGGVDSQPCPHCRGDGR